jgi:hypothetical protein
LHWLAILPLCLLASSVGPGMLIARRLRLSPVERLVCAVGLSFLLLYVVSFALYAAAAGPRWHVGVAAIYAGCTVACVGDVRRLWRRRDVRTALAALALFLLWGLLLLSFVRHFGGGTWSGDWLEHYQRTLFFLEHRPTSTLFIDQYLLPARPPMMNVLAAHYLAVTGSGYEKFQLVMLYLNALVLAACCLVAGNLFPARRHPAARPLGRPGLVLLFLAASPFVVQNLTYSWTKLFAAFYVIVGIHLYLRGLRKGSRRHVVLAFAFLAAGCLVHYSAGPYALFVALHYLVRWIRGRARWADAVVAGAISALVLATWFGWSVHTFGARTTFGANSTVSDSARMSASDNLRNVARNALNTLLPTVLRNPGVLQDEDLRQPSPDGRVRDFAFLVYQVSLPFALGTGGIVLAGYLLGRLFRRPASLPWGRPDERRFWAAFVPFTFLVGVAVYGGIDRFGVAHVTLQPLALLGLTTLAAAFHLAPLLLRRLLILFLLLDFAVGIQLHFNLQSRDFETVDDAGGKPVIAYTEQTLSRGAQTNWATKQREGLRFWGDPFKPYLWPMQVVLLFSYGALLAVCLKPYLSRREVIPRAGPRSG